MDEKIKELWNKNKLICCLLFIPLVLLAFRNVIIDFLVKDSRRIGNETAAKDAPLAQQQAAQTAQANQIVAAADKLDDNKAPVNEDWNKK